MILHCGMKLSHNAILLDSNQQYNNKSCTGGEYTSYSQLEFLNIKNISSRMLIFQ